MRAVVTNIADIISVIILLTGVGSFRTIIDIAADTVLVDIVIGIIRTGIADITDIVLISVGLILVGDIGTVVAGIAERILVGIGLILIIDKRAVITDIAVTVAVPVFLSGILPWTLVFSIRSRIV